MATRAQLNANAKYAAANYEQLSIRVPKGEKEIFQSYAKAAGLSLREFIRQACYEKGNR